MLTQWLVCVWSCLLYTRVQKKSSWHMDHLCTQYIEECQERVATCKMNELVSPWRGITNDSLYWLTYMVFPPLLHSIASLARTRTVFLGNVNTFWLMNEFKNNGSFSGAHRPRVEGRKREGRARSLLLRAEHVEACGCGDAAGQQWLLSYTFSCSQAHLLTSKSATQLVFTHWQALLLWKK